MKKWFQILMMVMLSVLSLKAEFLGIERQKALRENKLILLSIEKEGCPYCIKMQKDIFDVPKFNQRIAKNYLHVSINGEDPTLPQALHVKYFPTNLILSPRDLSIIDEFAGYSDPASFIELLDIVYAQEFK
ncbi:thioredoxin fold domain-containing protein [Sulfurospirillum multivorans]|uniref:Periplasmic thioredoxin SoxW n=2 Tax=Sulfurospirillum multivorans TaxID=66821 RepID=A0AA86AMQ9_SULMK|nr:thioredoxin fold domain-containing protein [Sulfurospirillum multivorans]AHJ13581.1 periplasmic thioredoxin SoxW [Sulfurospirillum multivorans DSM 12446]QEH07071.1 periplasmic thioredoxin SoxW [Sulfurospirillum multivorans]